LFGSKETHLVAREDASLDFSLNDDLDKDACYSKLVELLHPGGLACTDGRQRQCLEVHHHRRETVLDYALV
jgi:hypothetical protein